MKLLVAVFLCLTFAAVFGEISDEVRAKLRKAGDKCQEDPKTAVDREALKKHFDSKGKEPAPPNTDANSVCVSKELKWQKADGTVDKDYVKERIQLHESDPVKVQEILDECAVDKATEVETSKHLFKCLIKYADKK